MPHGLAMRGVWLFLCLFFGLSSRLNFLLVLVLRGTGAINRAVRFGLFPFFLIFFSIAIII